MDSHRRRLGVRLALKLRAIAEVYESSDAKEKLVAEFVAPWDKVNLDRFDFA